MRIGRHAAIAAVIGTALGAGTAYAYVTTDLNNFNLTDSCCTTWPSDFHTSSGSPNGHIWYRWLDSPNKTTVISANYCGSLAPVSGTPASIPAGSTDYYWLGAVGSGGICFKVRGRTAIGSGSMVNHDGRVQR